jgi:hypothetical protein
MINIDNLSSYVHNITTYNVLGVYLTQNIEPFNVKVILISIATCRNKKIVFLKIMNFIVLLKFIPSIRKIFTNCYHDDSLDSNSMKDLLVKSSVVSYEQSILKTEGITSIDFLKTKTFPSF